MCALVYCNRFAKRMANERRPALGLASMCSKPCAAALTDRCDALIKRSTDHATLLFCSVLEFGPARRTRALRAPDPPPHGTGLP